MSFKPGVARLVMSPSKQVIVVDDSLGMSRGKMIAQACHASLKAYEEAREDRRKEWKSGGQKKVVLKAGGKDLENIRGRADEMGLPASLVTDAGLTEIEPGTDTAVGIGPSEAAKIDTITGELETIK